MLMTIRRKILFRQLGRVLRRHALDVLEDLIIPGAYDGLTRLHFVALTPAGIVCVLRKHCHGSVSGHALDAQWSDERGGRRNRFLNPVIQNQGHVKAVSRIVTDLPISGLVVFSGAAQFANEVPGNVVHLSSLEQRIAVSFHSREVAMGLDGAWQLLKSSALTDDASRKDLNAQLSFG